MNKKNPYIFPFLWIKGEHHEKIVEEIEKIQEAGIDEFVLESRTHPSFLKDKWWRDFRFILETAKERDMRVWLLDDAHFPTGYANGVVEDHPELQKRYLYYSTVDVFSEGFMTTLNLNLLKKPRKKWSDRKQPQEYYAEIEKNKKISVSAFPLIKDAYIGNQSIDLLDYAQEEYLNFKFPKGNWRIFVVYETTENGGQKNYINMLEKDSVQLLIDTVYQPHFEHFKEYFGNTFRGFFSDEPGFGNTTGFAKDEIIGKKDMALPWSTTLANILLADGKLHQYLPLLWEDTVDGTEKVIRLQYMNLATQLYSQNFSQQLGEWCRQRQVLYIGHIIEDNNMHARLGTGAGHYFRAMQGQSMAGIDIISGQITIGGDETFRTNSSKNDGVFYHYCLPKLADSSALLDTGKAGRAFCELYGAYGWQLSIRNMKWILDTLLVRGINHFVPHAFSMAEFPDLDSPPHFYAQGKNPQYPLFKKLMYYAKNISQLLNDGTLNAKIGVVYHGEFEWIGKYQKMQELAKELSQSQIDFLFIPSDWLKDAKITHQGVTINEHHFEKIIIPSTEYIPDYLAEYIQKAPKNQVLFINDYPKGIVGSEIVPADFKDHSCCSLTDVSTLLSANRMLMGSAKKLAVRHYQTTQQEILLFHNESLNDTFSLSPKLPDKKFVYIYDGMTDCYYRIAPEQQEFTIPPYGMLVFVGRESEIKNCVSQDSNGKEFPFNDVWHIQLKEQNCLIASYSTDILTAISEKYPKFSGSIEYTNYFEVEKGAKISLDIERVFDGCEIYLNNKLVDTLIVPPYTLNLQKELVEGTNQLKIIVYTTSDRSLQESNLLLTMFEPMEPTGIVGKVLLTEE
ncbi:hypothetical protein ACFC8T_15135 [Enterococcus casseliflavus]|uniref:hypothetical protein n=1 Tax=Enterococcus casseliflavus TaxID=37734 RepID=UPI0039A5A7BE